MVDDDRATPDEPEDDADSAPAADQGGDDVEGHTVMRPNDRGGRSS